MRQAVRPVFWRNFFLGILTITGVSGLLVGLFSPRWFSEIIGLSVKQETSTGIDVGSLAPNFALSSISGEMIQLNQLQGKPVLINFWATWCAPCVMEMPNIQKYYKEFDQQFEVLAVNAGEKKLTVEQFANALGIEFPVLLDPDNKIQSLYRVRGYPTTYVLDADGIIRAQHIGMLGESQIEEYLALVGVSK